MSKFKIGDKVKMIKQDERHAFYHRRSVPVNGIYTIKLIYNSGHIELKECGEYNYDPTCFIIVNKRKLKLKLP